MEEFYVTDKNGEIVVVLCDNQVIEKDGYTLHILEKGTNIKDIDSKLYVVDNKCDII